jgi:hypothetical protein
VGSRPEAESRDRTFLEASAGAEPGLIAELVSFLRENQKWWLVPFFVVLGLVGLVLLLSVVAPGLVPFIYPLF